MAGLEIQMKDVALYPDKILRTDEETGVCLDYNFGLRLGLLEKVKEYRVVIKNPFTGITYYNGEMKGGETISLNKKYYSEYETFVYGKDENGNTEDEPLFHELFSLKDQVVAIRLAFGFYAPIGLGDMMGMLHVFVNFQRKHQCKLYLVCDKDEDRTEIKEVIREHYPELNFIDISEIGTINPYASYYINFYFYAGNRPNGWDNMFTPVAREFLREDENATYALGMELDEDTKISLKTTEERLIKEKYVCIATKTTEVAKHWLYPGGWETVIKYLKENGYRVLCIDREKETMIRDDNSYGKFTFEEEAEDFTHRDFHTMVNLLSYCDFFIGLPSGLSWVADDCGAKVVLITGYTTPKIEFFTKYRVQNYDVCNSCYSDRPLFEKLNHSKSSCLRMDDKPVEQRFICSKAISPQHVINVIKKVELDIQKENG